MGKIKGPGRPKGAANIRNGKTRDNNITFRCSQGFIEVLDAMVQDGIYKSRADALHEAVQLLALKKLSDSKSTFWISQI